MPEALTGAWWRGCVAIWPRLLPRSTRAATAAGTSYSTVTCSLEYGRSPTLTFNKKKDRHGQLPFFLTLTALQGPIMPVPNQIPPPPPNHIPLSPIRQNIPITPLLHFFGQFVAFIYPCIFKFPFIYNLFLFLRISPHFFILLFYVFPKNDPLPARDAYFQYIDPC